MPRAHPTPAQIVGATRRVRAGALAAAGGRRTCPCARRDASGEHGFTLIEALIAAVVLAIGIAAFFNSLNVSVHAEASSRARESATNIAREILEDARTIPYAQLEPYDVVHELQSMP